MSTPRTASGVVAPWNQSTADNPPGKACCWCRSLLPSDCSGYFTLVVPWRDWRPIRYICYDCVHHQSTWNHLTVLDSVYLGVIEVEVVDRVWLTCTSLQFKPLDSLNKSFHTDYQLYLPKKDMNRTWLRFVRYHDVDMICVHVLKNRYSDEMHAVPLDRLESWNPTLPPFRFRLIHERIDLKLLESLTDSNYVMWWPVLKERLVPVQDPQINCVTDNLPVNDVKTVVEADTTHDTLADTINTDSLSVVKD